MHQKASQYRLRNEPQKTFSVEASAEGAGASGSVVRATVTRYDGLCFHYEIVFEGEFSASKPNFTEEMYLETALSIVHSQIESHVHRDTRMSVHEESGLMRTEPGAALDWARAG